MLAFSSIEVRGFRNLAPQRVPLGARFNVFAGENGQGKTNLLEAIYLVATSRSFRTSLLADVVAHGSEGARVRASIIDPRAGVSREQIVSILGTRRAVTLDGKRPRTLATFALATPVVIFEPASLVLSQGPAGERRKLLDRVAVQVAAREGGGEALIHDAERYRRALLQRKRALENNGDSRTIASFEHVMAEHGARIVEARARATDVLRPHALAAFARIAREGLALDITYAPKAPSNPEAFAALLYERRDEDRRRGAATRGPHLDDLALALDGHPARRVASQGQHRAIVLALKGAELETIREAREVEPVLLLDDVSSELDPARNAALFHFLHERQGQVLLTTTRPELIEIASERADFRVSSGTVEPT
ncbi:MAG: DNA replication/repair protein RecF [Polyangiales bacterium]